MVCIFPFAERIQEYMGNPRKHFAAKVNNRNARKKCEICSKLTKDLPEECHWRRQCFYCWLWACIWFAENMEMYLHTGNYSYIPTMHRVKKISEFGVFSGPCFLVFLLGTGKYGPEKTLYSENFQAVINL